MQAELKRMQDRVWAFENPQREQTDETPSLANERPDDFFGKGGSGDFRKATIDETAAAVSGDTVIATGVAATLRDLGSERVKSDAQDFNQTTETWARDIGADSRDASDGDGCDDDEDSAWFGVKPTPDVPHGNDHPDPVSTVIVSADSGYEYVQSGRYPDDSHRDVDCLTVSGWSNSTPCCGAEDQKVTTPQVAGGNIIDTDADVNADADVDANADADANQAAELGSFFSRVPEFGRGALMGGTRGSYPVSGRSRGRGETSTDGKREQSEHGEGEGKLAWEEKAASGDGWKCEERGVVVVDRSGLTATEVATTRTDCPDEDDDEEDEDEEEGEGKEQEQEQEEQEEEEERVEEEEDEVRPVITRGLGTRTFGMEGGVNRPPPILTLNEVERDVQTDVVSADVAKRHANLSTGGGGLDLSKQEEGRGENTFSGGKVAYACDDSAGTERRHAALLTGGGYFVMPCRFGKPEMRFVWMSDDLNTIMWR